jgi:hypothetical protein
MQYFTLLIFFISVTIFAHSGRTGILNCHFDNKSDEKHCHHGRNTTPTIVIYPPEHLTKEEYQFILDISNTVK